MLNSSMLIDYLVFVALICSSLGVTLYQRYSGAKEKTKAEYVFAAGSQVSMGAMLLSFARGTLGVRSFLGYPSELYYYGTGMYEIIYGMLLAYPIVSYLFVPVYYNLGITSVYQYLDLRFKSRAVRTLASGTYIFRNMLNLGVTVFTPCVALKIVCDFPYWLSIGGIVTISVLCSILGGLKAAIMADVIQGLIMIGCTLAIIIKGLLDTGGVDHIIEVNYEHGRLKLFNFNTDPTLRVATISAFFGQLFMSLSIYGCQQNFVQRICSMDTLTRVRRTLWAIVPVIATLFTLSWVSGMVIFADYLHCDPLSLGFIDKIDEILPFYIEDKFTKIPGLLGVFMASLFNGALSLSVSNLSSMATVAWEDFISKLPCTRNFTEKQQLLSIKLLNVVFGVIITGIAFGVAFMSGVIESSQLMTSATSGPLLGVFILAMFFPVCNWKGAVGGMIMSHAITLWIVFGSLTVDKPKRPFLPLSTDGCNNNSFSSHSFPSHYWRPKEFSIETVTWSLNGSNDASLQNMYIDNENSIERNFLTQLYSITYMYYSLIGCASCLFFGLLVSYCSRTSADDLYEEKLIHPLAYKISKWFPGKPRTYLAECTGRRKSEEQANTTPKSDYQKNIIQQQNLTKKH